MYKIRLKTWKSIKSNLTDVKSVNSVKSVWFYEFTKFMIWTKSCLNLILKRLLISFVNLNRAEHFRFGPVLNQNKQPNRIIFF
jgi:hypothetical protein